MTTARIELDARIAEIVARHAALGLKRVEIVGDSSDAAEVGAFLSFVQEHVEREASFAQKSNAAIGGTQGLLSSTSVKWERYQVPAFPLFIETLVVAPSAEGASAKTEVPLIAMAGTWRLSAIVVDPCHARYWQNERETWTSWLDQATAAEARSELSGGMAYNVLTIPTRALASGEIDIRSSSLRSLGQDGHGVDRGDVAAQGAIANAFWQTYWATGALRAERGVTFPVAFLPIDRKHPGEFEPPFHERYVSLRRRLLGRTSIVGYALEELTKARALLFDHESLAFGLSHGFEHKPEVVAAADIMLALDELNATGWIDISGDWASGWREAWIAREARWRDVGTRADAGKGPAHREARGLKIKSRASAEDWLATARLAPGREEAGRATRVRRVVPYSGCAFLGDVVNSRRELEESGKLSGLGEDDEIIAATNSTFFLNFPEEYSTLHSAMNDLVALHVEDGETHQVKTMRRATFVLGEDGRAMITTRAATKLNCEALVFEGESSSGSFALRADKPFRQNSFGPLFFGAVVVGDSIVETFEEMATEMPANGWIVGDSEAFGGRIEPRRAAQAQVPDPARPLNELKVRHAFSAGPLLVEKGRVVPLGESREDFHPIRVQAPPSAVASQELSRTQLPPELLDAPERGVPPSRFPWDWDITRAPRTAIGIKADGSVALVVVDGRARMSHSVGMTLAELADLMISLGCDSAMNLDGGGSSIMYVTDPSVSMLPPLAEGLGKGVVSLPSDMGGKERLLPVPLLVVKRANGSRKKADS